MTVVPCMFLFFVLMVVEPCDDCDHDIALHTSVSSSVAEHYTLGAFLMCFLYVTFIVLLF